MNIVKTATILYFFLLEPIWSSLSQAFTKFCSGVGIEAEVDLGLVECWVHWDLSIICRARIPTNSTYVYLDPFRGHVGS